MCDTLVALGNSTEDGNVVFGKNSDRPQTEAQLITYNPRSHYQKGEDVKCSYISIPQVSETAAVYMSQPFWMFGCEMGSNEYGVVIGNEAVYSKEEYHESWLLGMDLLRLGLERGKSAKDRHQSPTDTRRLARCGINRRSQPQPGTGLDLCRRPLWFFPTHG